MNKGSTMSKTKTSTPTEISDEETNKIDSNAAEADSGKSNALGKDPGDVPMHDEEDNADNILTPQEKANAEFMSDMTDFKDETDDEDFVEGAQAPKAKAPTTPTTPTTPAGEVVQAAGKTPAQSELEASNVAKGLNPDGTAKEPTPQAPPPVVAPELNADGTPKVAAPVQQQPVTPPVDGGTPEAAPTPEQMTEYYRTWRTQTEDVLAKTHYRLSQEQIDELDTNPVEMLPKVMAKVYLDAVTATMAQINANFPRLVNEVLERNKVGDAREQQFFEAWPDLKGEAPTVLRIAGAYRQMNPNATTDDFIREVGAQAMVTLRKPIPGMANGNGAPPIIPAKAFKPAAATPPSTGAAPPPKNPYEVLNDSFDEDFDTD